MFYLSTQKPEKTTNLANVAARSTSGLFDLWTELRPPSLARFLKTFKAL